MNDSYTTNPEATSFPDLDMSIQKFKETGKLKPEPQIMMYRSVAEHACKGKRVVDVGCGIGWGTNALAHQAAFALGADLTDESIRFAREMFQLPNIRYEQVSITNDPMPQSQPYGSFDVITMIEIIEHVEDYNRALNFVKRMFGREDGQSVFFISSPNRNNQRFSPNQPRNCYHVREWTASEFVEVLKTHFKEVKLYSSLHLGSFEDRPEAPLDTDDTPIIAQCSGMLEDAHHHSNERKSMGAPRQQPAQSIDQLLEQAMGLHHQGQRDAAINIYDQILSQEPNHCDALHLRGHALMLENKSSEAEGWVLKAIQSVNNAPLFWHTLASISEKLGKSDQMIQALKQALQLDPQFAPARKMVERLQQSIKQTEAQNSAQPHILIDTHFAASNCQIKLTIEDGSWKAEVLNNNDPIKISNESIVDATHKFLHEYLPITPNTRIQQTAQFPLQNTSVSLFNWRDILCGRVKALDQSPTEAPQTNKLGAFGFLAGAGAESSKPLRLKFIELSKEFPEKFEYIATEKFSPQMNGMIDYVDYKKRFKYVIDIPGHTYLTKIYWMLFTQRPIFYAKPNMEFTWERLMKPFVHYIPVAADMSNLVQQYNWAESHPEACKEIAHNAYQLATTDLSEETILQGMAERIRQQIESV